MLMHVCLQSQPPTLPLSDPLTPSSLLDALAEAQEVDLNIEKHNNKPGMEHVSGDTRDQPPAEVIMITSY